MLIRAEPLKISDLEGVTISSDFLQMEEGVMQWYSSKINIEIANSVFVVGKMRYQSYPLYYCG